MINIYIIEKEIKLFFKIDNTPSVIIFDKNSNEKLNEYVINIQDLCCEYCLYRNIEELLIVDGIINVYSDYDSV